MVCPACRLLAPIKSGLFELKPNPFHPDRTHYEHINCNKSAKRPAVGLTTLSAYAATVVGQSKSAPVARALIHRANLKKLRSA